MEAPVFPKLELGKEAFKGLFKRNKEKRKLKFNKELEILALVLQFISFWFAAPEIVGERILKKLEAWFLNGPARPRRPATAEGSARRQQASRRR